MSKTCVLVLDNIRSVENVGSIFRTAEGLGVGKIYLIGTTPAPLDRFGRKRADMAKVALGAEELVEWEHGEKTETIINELRTNGFQIISLEQTKESKDLSKIKNSDISLFFALVVGNEVEGVSKEALKMSDEIVEIEMRGEKESLNVSVSTGIVLYELLN